MLARIADATHRRQQQDMLDELSKFVSLTAGIYRLSDLVIAQQLLNYKKFQKPQIDTFFQIMITVAKRDRILSVN